jgi:rubrerythrin
MGWLEPGELPFQNECMTSEEAAANAAINAETLRGNVLGFLTSCGVHGATDDEIQVGLKLHVSTQVPRRRELVLSGKVMESGFLRKTRKDCRAIVWIASDVAAAHPEAVTERKSARKQLEEAKREIVLLNAEIEKLHARAIIRVAAGKYSCNECGTDLKDDEILYYADGRLKCPECGATSGIHGIIATIS